MFYVIEIQVNNGVASHLVTSFDNRRAAMSDFHRVLQYAAISTADVHSCVVIDERGGIVATDFFEKDVD